MLPSPSAPGSFPGPLVVLGGGPAGLATALYAHRAGIRFQLFERSARLGGLCRTFACGGHRYDSGAHRFHDRDPEITADLRAWTDDRLVRVEAPSRILHGGRYTAFPPSPLDWLRSQGLFSALVVGGELLRGRLRPRPERSFADRAINLYGERLGRPLLIAYSEKLWGLPASELSPEVATRRLSGLGLAALMLELFLPHRRSAHLDGSFLYPRGGYGTIADSMAAMLPSASLHPDHEVTGFDCDGGRIRAVRFAGRPQLEVPGRVVVTLPLGQVVCWLGSALPDEAREAAAGLRFRHLRLVFLRLDQERLSDNATIYLPDPRLAVSRVSEPRNRWRPMAPPGETGLLAEVPCSSGDELHGLSDQALAERVVGELAGVGLIDCRRVLEWRHHLLANAYPVYARDYAPRLAALMRALAAVGNLDLLGRSGRFWYSHLHDQLRAAKDYVRSLVAAEPREPRRPSMAAHMHRSEARL
ncbi:MAG TPA: FAD-dependent oxidoreductase [Vicinamibacteria bacterium]|nr:FAD-dependent oxidoreductase [Vicinamibacteria bacterium]